MHRWKRLLREAWSEMDSGAGCVMTLLLAMILLGVILLVSVLNTWGAIQ